MPCGARQGPDEPCAALSALVHVHGRTSASRMRHLRFFLHESSRGVACKVMAHGVFGPQHMHRPWPLGVV